MADKMNFEKRLENLLDGFLNIAEAVWLYGSGLEDRGTKETKAFIRAELIIVGIMLFFIVAGWALKIKGLVVFGGAVASIAMIVAWVLGDLAVRIISKTANIVIPDWKSTQPLKEGVESLAETLKKLLAPLITLSMCFSFLAAVTALKGVYHFAFRDLMIWGTLILFFSVFAEWINIKTKAWGWLMFGWVILLLVRCYLAPVPTVSMINSIEGFWINKSISADHDNLGDRIINVPENTILYESRSGEFIPVGTAKRTTKAKVLMDGDRDDASGEILYKAIFPVDETGNNYIGGEMYYINARSVEPEVKSAGQARVLTPEEQLQMEVKRLTEQGMDFKELELNYANPKIKIFEDIQAGDKIHYLSLNDFWSENEKELRIWPASKSGDFWALYMKSDMNGDSTPVWFKMNKKPTIVYYWVERDSS